MRTSRDQSFLFLTEPPEALLCPLHYGVYEDPVVLPCGHTFCHECVELLSKHKPECPLDRTPFTKAQLIPNRCVVDQVEALIILCPNGVKAVPVHAHDVFVADPHGCPHLCTIASVDIHLQSCSFGASDCPESASSSTESWSDIGDEASLSCPNAPMGCRFRSSASEMGLHRTRDCTFAATRSRLMEESLKIQLLKMKSEMQASEISILRSQLQRENGIPSRNSPVDGFEYSLESDNPLVFIGEFTRSISSKISSFASTISEAASSLREMFRETEEQKQERVRRRLQERARLEAKLAQLRLENEQIRHRKTDALTSTDAESGDE